MIHPFHAHVALLQFFLGRRDACIDYIERLLNCQKEAIDYQQDLPLLSRQLHECFFGLSGLTREQANLRDQLEQAHWASGFKPRAEPGNALVDPAEQMLRGFGYELIDVEADRADYDEMIQLSGQSKTPTLVTREGAVLPDFGPEELESFVARHGLKP